MADIVSKEKRSENMSAIRSKDTKPEVFFRKKLFALGLRYRKNSLIVFGHPDIFLSSYNTAIFVNGCFWHRHAEILYPGEFEIDSCIKWVLCRNNVERITLLNYLKEENMNAYQKYLEKIKVCREDLFEKNGLFVSECQYHSGVISVSFSESFNKEKYTRRMMLKNQVTTLGPIRGRLELMWPDVKSGYNPTAKEVAIDYEKTKTIQFRNIPEVPSAKSIKIRFFVEESPMCFIEQPLGETELIK